MWWSIRTGDSGRSWKRIDGALPQDVYLHAVREDPARKGLLYLGTERGVMFSPDDGVTWSPLRLNLPTVAVHDLVVKDNDLVVATHGRSLWILDDLTPIREWTGAIAAKPAHIFSIPAATLWNYRWAYGRRPSGPNPPEGATFTYHLGAVPTGPVTIEIVDGAGRLIRSMSSIPKPLMGVDESERPEDTPKAEVPADSGMHRVTWDFQHDGAKAIRNGKIDTGDPRTGPRAVPGRYTIRLRAGEAVAEATVEVKADPREAVSQADLEAQLAFALQVRDEISRLTGLVDQLRSVQDQLRNRNQALAGKPEAAELVKASALTIAKAFDLEKRLHNPTAEVTYDILAMKGGAMLYSRMSPLVMWASEGAGAPTQGLREVFAGQKAELDTLAAEVRALMTADVADLNRQAAALGLGYVIPE
jgi:hypothetical protein